MTFKPTLMASKTALIIVLSLFSGVTFSADSVDDRLKRLEQMAESRGQLQADVMFQLNAIQQELQQLRGQIEDHEFRLKQLQDRQRDLYTDIERRLEKLQSGGGVSLQTTGSTAVTNTQTSATTDVHSAYQSIFDMVRAKKYDESLEAYKAFLTQYPSSQYEANVHYWMAQIYYIQQNHDAALVSYKKVTSQFPDSPRVADSLLKQGRILLEKGDVNSAKQIFNQVIEQFDGTTEQLAKKELQALKSAGK